MKARTCPACKVLLTGNRSATKDILHPPRPGDISICFSCSAVSLYKTDLQLEQINKEQWEAFDLLTQADIKAARARLGKASQPYADFT